MSRSPHSEPARAVVATARAAWPTIEIDPARFWAFVQARLEGGDHDSLHAGDLYLACACASGDAEALRQFDTHFLARVGDFIARTGSSPALVDEVTQSLRAELLVGAPGAGPGIERYGGRGPLGAWVRTVAVRTALRLKRARGDVAASQEERAGTTQADPELEYMRRHYGEQLRLAFSESIAALPAKQRSLLRLYFVEGLTQETLADMFGVHRITVTRWINDLRKRLNQEVRGQLRDRLGLSSRGMRSVYRLVQSHFDLELRDSLLRTKPG